MNMSHYFGVDLPTPYVVDSVLFCPLSDCPYQWCCGYARTEYGRYNAPSTLRLYVGHMKVVHGYEG